ncbi:hypothetical protein OJF2_68850 [Aquisphaera giovannonii]|uniref:Uncharacterized protein n=1 Tax=Aquisphaera giovannonii TaxID=406548 RepID=A0A5B9WCN6_9BACT|nr:hypothetical protein [Aquisphaera giovannonii]QEH38287.1 hypothetical protein OJF2_68850 [Aquisphaera giovannonii]
MPASGLDLATMPLLIAQEMPLVPQAPPSHSAAMLLMVVLGLLGLLALGALYYRRRKVQASVEEQFRAFRTQAVSLMDQLDALRKRHKTLPADDPDFTVPMQGSTLSLYEGVNRDLDALWDRWLKVMEVWDQAQKRIKAGGGLGLKPTQEAKTLLEGGEITELVRATASCKERLDTLNRAHETARADLATALSELTAVQNRVTGGTGVLIPSDRHRDELRSAEDALRNAGAILAADPIGAEEQITGARWSLSALEDRPRPAPRATTHAHPTSYPPFINDLAAAVDRFRESVAKFRVWEVLGMLAKAWVFIWVVGLLFGLLTPLMPLFIILVGFLVMAFGGMAVMRSISSWMWFGMGRRWH